MKQICPLLKKRCIEHECRWFVQVQGMNPNTGAPMEKNQCAVELIPLLLIENSQQQRSTSAAVESFRNETLQKSETTNHLLYHLAQQPALITPVQVSTLEAGKN